GLGSSSYFGKVFREYAHCSPTEYRRKWQNSDR
ncbi:MAG: AraC family transcriptional regulator, partial [Lachnospiraceae bacterium]|nr:AraC family transcriptional regulator [Lachnospiraceae bacterium]MCI9327412.1 AraC family transcriptional regulator [Lachnospiraceae bacterium]